MKGTILGIIVVIILVAVVVSTIVVARYLFKASPETIHILTDGGISPSMANITTSDKVNYVFTGKNYVSIVVERNNITINGNGYTLQGSGATDAIGIYLSGRNNVTIKNMTINAFYKGISLEYSFGIDISGNTVTANTGAAIYLERARFTSFLPSAGKYYSGLTRANHSAMD